MSSQQVRQRARPPGSEQLRTRSTPADLPQPLTTFVGRAGHLAAVTERLQRDDVRLLTLAGPAGVGKTRIALTAAGSVEAEFADGVHFVPCTLLRSSDELPVTIAEVLEVQPTSSDPIESRLITHLRHRHLLLLLDNLEHILPLPYITRILSACQHVRILATSRSILHLSGEHEYVVPPMELPSPDDSRSISKLASVESVALLANRASQVSPEFAITSENADVLAAICTRLDGLPLAIELAAARMKIFPPAALLKRLSDRLSLLVGGPSDQPPHQRTIRDTIAWSHDLLSVREQRMFRRLAVFSGGITPHAAALACRDDDTDADDELAELTALDELTGLCDQSLLQQEKASGEAPRFFFLETVRHFALDQLRCTDELPTIQDRHASYYLDFAERASLKLQGADQAVWTERFDQEQSNIRDALQVLREQGDAERYTRLACAMFRFWRIRGKLIEGRSWLGSSLSDNWASRMPADLRARAFVNAGWFAWEQGDATHAEEYGEASLAIATEIENNTGIAQASSLLSIIDNRRGEVDRAVERMKLSLKHHRLAGDRDNIAGSLNNLALLTMESGDFERAAALCKESWDAFTNLGNLYGASHAIDNRGVALYCLGAFDDAMHCSRQALACGRTLEDKRCIAISLDHVGKCARALGDLEAAWEAHAESLPWRMDIGDPRGMLTWLEAMALWMVQAERAELAACALGAIEVVRISSNIPLQRHELGDHDSTVSGARAQLGDEHYDTLFARGRWQSIDESVAAIREAAVLRSTELSPGTTPDTTLDLSAISAQFGLTPRELDVLALIVQRYSDREIADALFISHRTVARHVTGLFNKLDVHSRRDAATMVVNLTTTSPPGSQQA